MLEYWRIYDKICARDTFLFWWVLGRGDRVRLYEHFVSPGFLASITRKLPPFDRFDAILKGMIGLCRKISSDAIAVFASLAGTTAENVSLIRASPIGQGNLLRNPARMNEAYLALENTYPKIPRSDMCYWYIKKFLDADRHIPQWINFFDANGVNRIYDLASRVVVEPVGNITLFAMPKDVSDMIVVAVRKLGVKTMGRASCVCKAWRVLIYWL